MLYIIYLTVFFSVFILGTTFLLYRPEIRMQKLQRKEDKAIQKEKTATHPLLRPFDIINKPLLAKLNREKLAGNLLTAKVKLSPEVFLGIKEIAMLALPFVVYLFFAKIQPLWIFILAGAGFLLPDMWVKTRINKFKEEILKALPDTIDLLSLCVGAGLDFMLAVKAVIEKSASNPLIDELFFTFQEIKMGKPRRDALSDMSKRLNINEVSSFARTLIQADRMGTSIAEALTMLSEDARTQRFRRGERLALKAPIKLLVPLIFFILPVVAIIVGGPVLLQFMQGSIKF